VPRVGARDRLAETYACEVIRASTDNDGADRAPMRIAAARITLGVAAGRQGDPELELALSCGRKALVGSRKSLPSLLMVTREFAGFLSDRYAGEPGTVGYLDQIRSLQAS
jgi:hypothetical protein